MQSCELLIGVLARALLAVRAGAQPEPSCAGLQPRRATPPAVAHPIHERMLDRKDSLLPARRRRCETSRLTDEHVVEPAEIDLNGWKLKFQIVAQATKRHPRSSR
jgi:hypothetical protein